MKRIICVLMAVLIVMSLASCGNSDPGEIKAGFLKGPTGVGASKLMSDSEEGKTEGTYSFTVESDVSVINSEIISGSLDIAAVPTNVAAVLYNKTEGKVKIAAVNTGSVLYILENGSSVSSVADLKGKTLYSVGQGANPEYVLKYVLEQNGLIPGEDVTIEFGDGTELAAKMAAGEIDLAMLPVPNVTAVMMKNSDVRIAIDMGEEWDNTGNGSTLTQGCIVVRTDAENIEAKLKLFLSDYKESIEFMSDAGNLDEAAALTVKYGIIGNEETAKNAIPECGLMFISDSGELESCLSGYFEVLFEYDKTSVGGAVPDEEIYFKS